MEKITIDNVFDKEQFFRILEKLNKHPEGLTLRELTYLLSDKKNMQNFSTLQERFKGESRKKVFYGIEPRKRIQTCLLKLKTPPLNLIYKDEEKYKLSQLTPHLLSLLMNINILQSKFKDACISQHFYNQKSESFMKEVIIKKLSNDADINFEAIITPRIQVYGIDSLQSFYDNRTNEYIEKIKDIVKKMNTLLDKLDEINHQFWGKGQKIDEQSKNSYLEHLNAIIKEIENSDFELPYNPETGSALSYWDRMKLNCEGKSNITIVMNTHPEHAKTWIYPTFLRDGYKIQ